MNADEKLLRDALDTLVCFGQEHNPNVGRMIAKLKDRLGEKSSAVGADDPYYADALQFVLRTGQCSQTAILRQFWIGYKRVALIQKALEDAGVLLPYGVGVNPEFLAKSNLKLVNE